MDNHLWVATQGGVVQYSPEQDEKTFFNRGNANIPTNRITSMTSDNEGKIWVSGEAFYGSKSGISYYNGSSWTMIDTLGGVLGKAPNGDIIIASSYYLYRYSDTGITSIPIELEDHSFCANPTAIAIDPNNGDIWVSAFDYGCHSLLHYDGQEFEVYHSNNSPLPFESPSNNSLFMDSTGKLWIGHWEGVITFDGENWVNYTSNNSDLPPGSVTSIQEDEDSNIWMGFSNYLPDDPNIKSLAKFDGQNWSGYELPVDHPSSARVTKFLITDFSLVVGTQKGLFTYDLNELKRIGTSNSALQSNNISSILQQDSYTWIANEHQLIRIKGNENEWTVFNNSDMPFESETGIFEILDTNQSGAVFVKVGQKICSYNNSNWEEFIVPDLVDNVDETDSKIKFDNNNNPWLFSYSGYIFRYTGSEWEIIPPGIHGNIGGYFNGIEFDPNTNDLWFGSYSGLFHFDGNNWTQYQEIGLSQNYINDLKIDQEGNIWIAQSHGIAQFDGTSFTIYQAPELGLTEVAPNFLSVEIDHQNHIWAGGYNLLVEYDGQDWLVYDKKNSGVPNRHIKCLSEDYNHNMWMGTLGGGFAIFNKDSIQNGVIHTATNEISTPEKLILYPNLLTNNQIINIRVPTNEINQNAQIAIFNNLGQPIYKTQLPLNQNPTTLDLSSAQLRNGLYFVTLTIGEQKFSGKFILMQ